MTPVFTIGTPVSAESLGPLVMSMLGGRSHPLCS
eukprot:CAMPEP_0169420846 /NCGR_PEP_ID=MMETSP1017-20121227/65777_1 /TAXON_ID=342587 /ORGANISM="Karlodinium micrum, Strain CCMP2283" /LENGTH=33 /DNA_ID= /DNA_START= /DNA_END= /DNA_ORIENTATION=